jgi:hypothetical protein
MIDAKWNQREKSISRAAFDKALKNECNHIIETIKEKAGRLSKPKEIWELEDYLYQRRIEIDQKYDYRYSVLIRVFGQLVREGWIEMKELEGLGAEKLERIQVIAGLND